MANHALLSASSSHRWLNCPPSARLCEGYDDKGSDFAAEGTDAHALCEYKLRKALGMEAEDPTENLTWYNTEMEDCASGYQQRYDALAARFDKAKSRLTEISDMIVERLARKHQVEMYLQELRERDLITEFHDADWLSMVDYMTVYSKKDIRVKFKDGTEIKA